MESNLGTHIALVMSGTLSPLPLPRFQIWDCILVTRNVRDFAHADVDVFNPWQDA